MINDFHKVCRIKISSANIPDAIVTVHFILADVQWLTLNNMSKDDMATIKLVSVRKSKY